MSRGERRLSPPQGQVIKGPANHVTAWGLYPAGSVEGVKQTTGGVSRVHGVPTQG